MSLAPFTDRDSDSPAATLPHEPLRVMFLNTSLEVGGAETLLVNLVRRIDRTRFAPEVCCLKTKGELGELLGAEVPVFSDLLRNKFDPRILGRLKRLFRDRRIDAAVTVGAGDKMFWGRLAAWRAGVPVIASALHSTGWPDGIGRLNRWLTPLTDMFIAVAAPHGRHLVEREGFPESKVCVIPNGVDINRFRARPSDPRLRRQLGVPASAPLAGILAALRPEKNHEMFLQVAAGVRRQIPSANFLVIGDGPEREKLERIAAELKIAGAVHFLGTRTDVPELLNLLDVLLLTSRNEANPVSILEALACGKPVVATRVGSVPESVLDEQVGYLVEPESVDAMTRRVVELFRDQSLAQALGAAGRQHVVDHWSLDRMVAGYEELLTRLHDQKTARHAKSWKPVAPV
ncbi:MAG TPA: glycosyltransferase [Pirellulales bacterium]|jgi:glycosyltransferase involved in cell wall biosynthesis|nr:glycosyltransferase [Pirellulales bacterium]